MITDIDITQLYLVEFITEKVLTLNVVKQVPTRDLKYTEGFIGKTMLIYRGADILRLLRSDENIKLLTLVDITDEFLDLNNKVDSSIPDSVYEELCQDVMSPEGLKNLQDGHNV